MNVFESHESPDDGQVWTYLLSPSTATCAFTSPSEEVRARNQSRTTDARSRVNVAFASSYFASSASADPGVTLWNTSTNCSPCDCFTVVVNAWPTATICARSTAGMSFGASDDSMYGRFQGVPVDPAMISLLLSVHGVQHDVERQLHLRALRSTHPHEPEHVIAIRQGRMPDDTPLHQLAWPPLTWLRHLGVGQVHRAGHLEDRPPVRLQVRLRVGAQHPQLVIVRAGERRLHQGPRVVAAGHQRQVLRLDAQLRRVLAGARPVGPHHRTGVGDAHVLHRAAAGEGGQGVHGVLRQVPVSVRPCHEPEGHVRPVRQLRPERHVRAALQIADRRQQLLHIVVHHVEAVVRLPPSTRLTLVLVQDRQGPAGLAAGRHGDDTRRDPAVRQAAELNGVLRGTTRRLTERVLPHQDAGGHQTHHRVQGEARVIPRVGALADDTPQPGGAWGTRVSAIVPAHQDEPAPGCQGLAAGLRRVSAVHRRPRHRQRLHAVRPKPLVCRRGQRRVSDVHLPAERRDVHGDVDEAGPGVTGVDAPHSSHQELRAVTGHPIPRVRRPGDTLVVHTEHAADELIGTAVVLRVVEIWGVTPRLVGPDLRDVRPCVQHRRELPVLARPGAGQIELGAGVGQWVTVHHERHVPAAAGVVVLLRRADVRLEHKPDDSRRRQGERDPLLVVHHVRPGVAGLVLRLNVLAQQTQGGAVRDRVLHHGGGAGRLGGRGAGRHQHVRQGQGAGDVRQVRRLRTGRGRARHGADGHLVVRVTLERIVCRNVHGVDARIRTIAGADGRSGATPIVRLDVPVGVRPAQDRRTGRHLVRQIRPARHGQAPDDPRVLPKCLDQTPVGQRVEADAVGRLGDSERSGHGRILPHKYVSRTTTSTQPVPSRVWSEMPREPPGSSRGQPRLDTRRVTSAPPCVAVLARQSSTTGTSGENTGELYDRTPNRVSSRKPYGKGPWTVIVGYAVADPRFTRLPYQVPPFVTDSPYVSGYVSALPAPYTRPPPPPAVAGASCTRCSYAPYLHGSGQTIVNEPTRSLSYHFGSTVAWVYPCTYVSCSPSTTRSTTCRCANRAIWSYRD
nr:MAG TPA: hypothetical protein [Caudoviricetes sp.]